VGNAAGEQAEGLEAVGLHELLGREAHLLGVAENDDDAARPAVGAERGAGGPDDGRRRCRAGGEEGVFAAEGQGCFGGERGGAGIVHRPAVLAVHELQHIADRLAGGRFRRDVQQTGGGGIHAENFAAWIGQQHALGEGGKGVRREAAGSDGRLRGGGRGRQGADKTGHPGDLAPAVQHAHTAEQDGDGGAVLALQGDGFEKDGLPGSAAEEPGFEAGLAFVAWEHVQEGAGVVGELIVLVAEEPFPGRREPEGPAGEIDLEGAQRPAVAEQLQADVAGHAGFLDLLALGDVEVQADDAGERAGLVHHLEAEAVDPHVMTEPVAQAELDIEGPRAGRGLFTDLERSRRAVVRVQQLQPSLVGGG
jgi:hypothetical protein